MLLLACAVGKSLGVASARMREMKRKRKTCPGGLVAAAVHLDLQAADAYAPRGEVPVRRADADRC